jgi:hypothetical protein
VWIKAGTNPLPLFEEPVAVFAKRGAERLKYRCHRTMERMAKTQRQSKMITGPQVYLPDQGDIAVRCRGKLVGEVEMGSEILPTVGSANIAAGTAQKGRGRGHRQPCPIFMGGQEFSPGNPRDVAVVAPAPDLQVWRKQRINVQPG